MLEFETISGHAKCAAAIIAALSLTERYAIQQIHPEMARTFGAWKDVVEYVQKKGIRTRSGDPINAFEYILSAAQSRPASRSRPAGRRRVKSRTQEPKRALAALLQSVTEHYFRNGSALAETLDKIGNEDHEIKEIIEFLCSFSDIERDEKGLVRNESSVYIQIITELEGEYADDGQLMSAFFENFVPFSSIPHIDFPSIPLLSREALMVEFHSVLSRDQRPLQRQSLFAVIREARGWTPEPNLPESVNSIVRDILWIKDPDEISESNRKSDGVFFSAFDHYIYLIEAKREAADSERRRNVVVNASMDEMGKAHHFYAFFPPIINRTEMWVDDCIIAGTARDSAQFGAWKALLIQPNWEFRERLNSLVYLFFDARDFQKIADLLSSSRTGDVLFDRRRVGESQAQSCRDAFRQLALGSRTATSMQRAIGGELRDSLEQAFCGVLEEHTYNVLGAATLPQGTLEATMSESARGLMSKIDAIIEARWHLIEPAQIITFLAETEQHRSQMETVEKNQLIRALLAIPKSK